MKIVTWNINSVRIRLDSIKRLAEILDPDVICLQETKVVDELFPASDIADIGYPHQVIRGMKSYNGVAILSRVPIAEADSRDWCGQSDCRHVCAVLPDGTNLHNFYIPAGGDIPDPGKNDKFAHKLQFLDELTKWGGQLKKSKKRHIMVGDFNIAPSEADVWSHKQLLRVVSHTPIEVENMERMMAAADWRDAVRHIYGEDEILYSWWSYRARDWAASNRGRRLDHIWVSPNLVERLKSADILREARGWDKASDHVPVAIELAD